MRQYRRSMFAASRFLAVCICGIAAILLLLDWNNRAYSVCQLNLPPDPVTMTVDVNEYKACDLLPAFTGYLDATLSAVPSGFSLENGTYAGFCADLGGYILDNPLFGNVTYQVQLLSSTDNPAYRERPWDKINYILTHYPVPQNSWLDIQAAIWTLIDGCTPQADPTLFDCQPHRTAYFPFGASSPYGCPPDGIVNKTTVQQIVDDANANGSGFTPGNGNLFAVIIDPQSCTGSSSSYNSYCSDPNHTPFQLLFTTATCSASYTVTPSAGANGAIDPSSQQTVNHNATPSFTITPDANYHAVMSGTCGGTLVGSTYTTNPVTADCTVDATFALDTHTVTSSQGLNGTIDPLGSQEVGHNTTLLFTVAPSAGYLASMSGTCGGNLVGSTYTTNPVTADCTVVASFVVAEPLDITTSSLPAGTVLIAYSQTLLATGGVLPYEWSVSGGALPDGLTINSATGEIAGTPTASGMFNFTALVTDATLSTSTRNLSIATEALPVRYGEPGGPINFDQIIQSAYDQCIDGYIIQVQDFIFTEDFFCDRPVTITLQGGFDEGYTDNPNFTTIQGKLLITDGTIVIENIIIQ